MTEYEKTEQFTIRVAIVGAVLIVALLCVPMTMCAVTPYTVTVPAETRKGE